jgi:hypothetical protein
MHVVIAAGLEPAAYDRHPVTPMSFGAFDADPYLY